MKRIIFFLMVSVCVQLLHAEYVILDSLRLTKNYTYKQNFILHEEQITGYSSEYWTCCEFTLKDTLYVMSGIFRQELNEFSHNIPDIPTLVQEILSICQTESSEGDRGFAFTYDSGLPATLTLFTFPNMDTIQYIATHSPELYTAVIRDTIFGSQNIKCGRLIQDLLKKLPVDKLYYDYARYNNIVLIPCDFIYSTYQERGYYSLPSTCLIIENRNGLINKIEVRRTDLWNRNGILKSYELY